MVLITVPKLSGLTRAGCVAFLSAMTLSFQPLPAAQGNTPDGCWCTAASSYVQNNCTGCTVYVYYSWFTSAPCTEFPSCSVIPGSKCKADVLFEFVGCGDEGIPIDVDLRAICGGQVDSNTPCPGGGSVLVHLECDPLCVHIGGGGG